MVQHELDPAAHIAALWPEIPWGSVNVLCEGPSIERLEKHHLLKGPCIAVNRALKLAETHRVDFWATSDAPALLWEWSTPYRQPGLRYFTTDHNIVLLEGLLGRRGLGKVYTAPHVEMGENDKGLVILPTIIPVLGWLRRQGVRKVRVFGADMTGHGTPLEGNYEVSSKRSHGRWKVERVLFSSAVRAFRSEGGRVERWPKKRVPKR